MTNGVAALEGAQENATGPTGPGRLRRIGPRRVVGAEIQEIYDYNRTQGWEQNYWARIDDTHHHMMMGTQFILPDNFYKKNIFEISESGIFYRLAHEF